MTEQQITTLIMSVAAFVITTLLGIIAYFLKQHFEAWKERNKTQSEHAKIIAVHIEKHEQTESDVKGHSETLKEHTTKLNKHDSNFATLGIQH